MKEDSAVPWASLGTQQSQEEVLERCGSCLRTPRAKILLLSWEVGLVGAEERANSVRVGDHPPYEFRRARECLASVSSCP